MDVPRVLVTGGTGVLGRRVVDRLRATGREVRVLSRSGGSGTVHGNLLTGEGLEQAAYGVDAVVHCASDPRRARRIDVQGTERLVQVAARTGVSHIVFISITGVDLNPYYRYYRAKLEAEQVVTGSPVPWTILRATQFHEFVLRMLQLLGRGPVAVMPKGFLLQPIDVGEVATRLAELVLSTPAGRVPDVGGPEVRTAAELAHAYLERTGHKKRLLEIPLPGKVARAFREGAQVCPDCTYGEITWEEFLHARIEPAT